ncbi:MAG: glycosyltransferase [Candidatus Saccharibacteria bacterium]|nr:glycosyltransferase [Candidatus Saccharibacteria bacterium]
MRIVIASDIYYPMTNGVAVFAHNLALGLARRGHEVLVFSPSFNGKRYDDNSELKNLTTAYLTSLRFPFYPDQINEVPDKKNLLGVEIPRLAYKHGIWASINPYLEIRQKLEEFQPDVIHLQTAETIALAIVTYARRHNIPLVSTSHAYPDNITGQFKFLKPVKRPVDTVLRAYMNSFLKHSEYATMPTEMAIEDLIPKNRKRFQVTVEPLSNGVDLSQFYPKKVNPKIFAKYDLDPKRPRIVNVGRVDPEKSIDVLIKAFAEVVKKLPEAELLIIGDGIARAKLEEQVVRQELSKNIKFLGRIMPPDLNELYRTGNLFATASETETQGIVLIEAAATGLPLVAVDAGAVKEVCQTGKNGILCQPKDTNGIATAMIKILRDGELQKKYSEGSINIAKKHDINYTLSRFEEIYGIAIQKNSQK